MPFPEQNSYIWNIIPSDKYVLFNDMLKFIKEDRPIIILVQLNPRSTSICQKEFAMQIFPNIIVAICEMAKTYYHEGMKQNELLNSSDGVMKGFAVFPSKITKTRVEEYIYRLNVKYPSINKQGWKRGI